ncbi:ESX-2 secretion system protein EccE2 [Mycolicibacterium canariasense]|uniref:ESX-2 secretion system protein EccE2 n=2 Tax=Mycolicibacterium canariasense TaxID=228230 RepID=A0A100WGQ4_MYCCR|nr:type VII secretion protein EccE [Mycolicibacterium canariasense]GAS97971.1 ESX-2 secretion system protein EccE2 [Mycolicibacterium canariasense]
MSPAPADRLLVERLMPLTDLLLVEVTAGAGLAFALLLNEPEWWGALWGLVAGLILVVPLAGRSLPRWALARIDFWRDRRRRPATAHRTAFDHEQPDGTAIGFFWDGATLTSLIRLDESAPSLNVLEPGGAVPGDVVPMGVLADCLGKFDIALQSIDVISQGHRSAGHGHVAAVYDAVLGPLSAVAHRSVWVAVRLDPAHCPDAVRARGGGWDGALRTAAVATRRVANRLRDAGLGADTTTASDMSHAVAELSGGVSLDRLEETWTDCRSGRVRLRSYGIGSAACTTEGIGSLWTLPSRSTTVTLSLRRHEQPGAVELRAIVRLDSVGGGRPGHAGVRMLSGRQFDALLCTLPLLTPRRPVGQWITVTGDAEAPPLAGLELSASGCGQVVGADEYGRAIALPLFGPRVGRVELHGTLHLAQQVVLRSLALGARVRVHTRRTGAWRAMAEAVGDVDQLQIVGTDRGAIEAGARRDFTVEMFDGTPEQSVRMGLTTVVVSPTHSAPSTAADVRLQLLDEDRDEVLVTTRTGSATVTMVASDEEMRYIGASFDVVDGIEERDQPAWDWPSRQEQR